MRRERAFTVVELMITMAIVVALIGLIVPVLGRYRKAAMTTKCLSNLKSLEQAHWLYASDRKGRFVDANLPHGGLPMDEELSWVTELRPYYSSEVVLRSPMDTSSHWASSTAGGGGAGGGGVPIAPSTDRFRPTSYGLNNYLTKFSPAAAIDPAKAANRLSRVPDAANTVHFLMMAFEGEFAGSDHVHAEEWWVGPLGSANLPWLKAATQMQINAHGGDADSADAKSNYSFVDGHVETLMFSEVFVNDQVNRFDPDAARFFGNRVTLGH